MPRLFAANEKHLAMTAKLVTYPLMALLMAFAFLLPAEVQAQTPELTTINDTIYRADGTTASGTVLIFWPSFVSAAGNAVAAGNLTVMIGSEGAFTAQLVPNQGASPAGTYYTAIFQLDDGTVRTEYWMVPTTSPVTIAAILTTPGTGAVSTAASQQYVNAAVAALNSTVVHLGGTETVTGVKTFSVPPELPTPAGPSDAANKGYVDAAVSTVGTGAYVAIAGSTMTGPLTLPGDPTAPNQAADRNYVDNGLAAKAGLVNGIVPTSELGTGVANSATCLTGSSTWGACGGGAPAGITYATTALNWTQTITSALTGGTQATVTLTPCPVGIDTTSGVGYQVLLSGGGNKEAANVIASPGGCMSGAASGTITFTPFYSYPAGYTMGSASSGLQETVNAACGSASSPGPWVNGLCNVTIPANGPGSSLNTYNVYGTVFFHANQSSLSGYGVALNCTGRGPCLQIGDLVNSNDYTNNTISGLSFRTPTSYASNPSYAGVAITQTQRTSQVVTITTASAHGFRVGDMVTILFTDASAYWGDAVVTAVPSATTFQYSHAGANLAAQATPGVVALAYTAVLDNAGNSHFIDIAYNLGGEAGAFNNFFDFWDDENASIDHFNNESIPLNDNANWTGSFVFSAGNQSHQIAPVITLRDSTITAGSSNGITDYNSNGLYIENTVIQATGPWQVYSSNTDGNYQGAFLKNVYSESSPSMNPASPARSPFAGLGIAGLIAGATSGAGTFQVTGSGTPLGGMATGGSGSIPYTYYIVVNDSTAGTQTSPMPILTWNSTGSDSIPVKWPRVASGTDTITYDVIRMTTAGGVGANLPYPYSGGCPGGAGGTCGYVAKGLTQSGACSSTLVCSYTDTGSSSTQAYTINIGDYAGSLIFWPGSLVSVNKSIKVDTEVGSPVGAGLYGNPIQIANQCTGYGQASSGGYTACLGSLTGGVGNGIQNQSATMLTDGGAVGGGQQLSKGRLNFSATPYSPIQPHHIITLIDSQPGLTQATLGYRPPANANDVWIGTDVPSGGVTNSSGQLAFGAPVSITNYIGQVGDGVHANWLERLSVSLKEFNVPAKFDQNVTVGGSLILPQGSGYVPAAGGIGLDTAAGLPVVNIGGTTHQVAFTSSNISGQAGTAVALAATPTQCSGSFATGIAANGNANCTTPDVIQLPETAAPTGIPNWGVFWFDSATHTPRVIDNAGQVVQLGLTNLFNSDPGGDPADNVEERNGSNSENLRVYSNYANSTTWQRTSLGFDATDNYAVVRSENATSALAPGLGLWVGSGLKWVVDATGNLKPWAATGDNVFNVGSDSGNAVKSVFAKTSFNSVVYGRNDFEIPNDGMTGTGLNQLAVLNVNSPSQAVVAGTASTNGLIGVVQGGAGKSGNAVVTWHGYAYCVFDNATIAGDAVVASTTTAGDCHDTGTPAQPGVQLVGYVDITNTTSGQTNGMRVNLQPPVGGGSVTSVFGRSGVVTAASGDYSVSQVTGAAADAAVVHLAGTETITGAKTFTSNLTLNGNLSVAGSINQTGTGPTQWSGQEWTGTTVTVPTGMAFSLGVTSAGQFACQLATGASCLPSSSSGVSSVFGRTGAVTAQSGDYTAAQVGLGNVTNNAQTQAAIVPNTAPGAGQILVGNSGGTAYAPQSVGGDCTVASTGAITCSKSNGVAFAASATTNTTNASNITSGTLPHAQLPALVSGDIPNNAANTTGTAANLSGTPAVPNGTTATTQSSGDNSAKLATTAYVRNESQFAWTCPVAGSTAVSQNCNWTLPAALTITGFDFTANTAPVGCTTNAVVQVWDGTAGVEVGSYSIALSAGTNFYPQVTGSTNVASGHLLRVKVTTAAVGCSTNAGGMVATVTYQMQN